MASTHVLWYSFSIALFLFIVLERVVHAIGILVVRLFWGGEGRALDQEDPNMLLRTLLLDLRHSRDIQPGSFDSNAYYLMDDSFESGGGAGSSIKAYASMQMVGAGATFFSAVGSAVASAVVSAGSAMLSYAIWAAAATLLFALLYVVQENRSDVFISAVDEWNNGYGPLVHKIVFIPLQVGFWYSSCMAVSVKSVNCFSDCRYWTSCFPASYRCTMPLSGLSIGCP